jgi:glutamate N-acetyltransferase/amino-acid N-acetyltransferase
MVRDAEGASKDIEITVRTAATEADALEAARAVGRSNLLKCALHGNDPNWGRVLAAVGTTSAAFAPDALDVAINDVQVCRAGAPGEDRTRVDLSGREVRIVVDLHAGSDSATVWTSDLTAEYVHENSAYST